jgi:hypothetical protein
MEKNLEERLHVISDEASADLQPYSEKSLADEIQVITDALTTILATSRVEAIGDELKIILDEPGAVLESAYAGTLGDTVQVIRDALTWGLINLTLPLRWVAPTTITPSTTAIDPIYLAAHPVRHPTIYFEPRVKSYGAFTRAIAAPVGFVKTGDVTLSVLDPDNILRRKISAKTIKKATVDMRLGPEGGSYKSFLRPWKRKVFNVSQPSDSVLSFQLKDNAFDFYERYLPSIITEANFPNLPSNVSNTFANNIVGVVSSANGAVPCPLVDTVYHWYLVMSNPAKSVDGVFRRVAVKDESDAEWELVSSSEYTIRRDVWLDHGEGSGDYGTIIQFTSEQTSEIRANVSGIYNASTGVLSLTNFADYLLAVFNYLSFVENQTDILNLASFEETRLKVTGLLCAGAITQKLTYGELIARIQRSSNIDVFADKNDRIAIHYTGDDDVPTLDLDHVRHLYGGSVSQQMADPVFNRFKYKYAPDYASNTWTEAQYDNEDDQVAVDGEIMEDPEDLSLFFVRDAVTADTVVRHRAQYCRLESFRFEGKIPLIPVLEDLELGDLVRITHFGGFASSGYVGKQFKILKLIMDVDRLSYQFEGVIRKLAPPTAVVTKKDGSGSGGDPDSVRVGLARVMPATNCRPGPYKTAIEGELFVFFKDSLTKTKLIAYYTPNFGVSWYECDAANAPQAIRDIGSYDCCVDDNANDGIAHLAFTDGAYECGLYYVTFNMTTRTWGTQQTVKATIPGIGTSTCCSIECRYPGGEPVIAYQGERRLGILYPTELYNQVYAAIKIGGTWQTDIEVSPDGMTYEFWSFGTMIIESQNYVQRVIAGRDNRMHFFFLGANYRQYVITMNSNLSLQQPPRYYKNGYQCGTHGVVEGFVSEDHRLICLLKRYASARYVDSFTEGSTIVFNASTKITGTDSEGASSYAIPMSGFFGQDGSNYMLDAINKSFGTYPKYRTSSDGLTWTDGVQCGPSFVYPSVVYRNFGSFIKVGSSVYCAQLTGPEADFPIYRWLKVANFPYTGA